MFGGYIVMCVKIIIIKSHTTAVAAIAFQLLPKQLFKMVT